MKTGLVWLANAFGARRGAAVAQGYRSVFGTGGDDGRHVLEDLARYCRFGATSFVAGDPHQTAFNEGARDVFLHIVEMIGLAPAELTDLFTDSQTTEPFGENRP